MATHGEIRWPSVGSFDGRLRGDSHGRRHACRPFHKRATRARRRFLSHGRGSARVCRSSSIELNDDAAVRRRIVEDAVSGPGHGCCRFRIAEQHSGAERLGRHVLTSRAAATWAMNSMPDLSRLRQSWCLAGSRRFGGRRALSRPLSPCIARTRRSPSHERVTRRSYAEVSSSADSTQASRLASSTAFASARSIPQDLPPTVRTWYGDKQMNGYEPRLHAGVSALGVAPFRVYGCRAPC